MVREIRTLVHASHIKMPAEPHQRRRRNVELLEIQIHDRWTELKFVGSRADLCDRQREPGRPDG